MSAGILADGPYGVSPHVDVVTTEYRRWLPPRRCWRWRVEMPDGLKVWECEGKYSTEEAAQVDGTRFVHFLQVLVDVGDRGR